MWGANDPQFTWLDMESLLNGLGLLHTRTVAASLGGSNDRGRGLSPRGRELLQEAITRHGAHMIDEPTLDESIARRIEIFNHTAEPRGVRAYVNIGGSSASIGTSLNGTLIPPGINRALPNLNWTRRGVLHHYARRRVPVVHVLRVQSIAADHGFPISAEFIPTVGEGEIFYREVYDLRVVAPAFVLYVVLCFGVLRARHYAAQAAREGSAPALILEQTPAPPGIDPAADSDDATTTKGSRG
jgi:hypothetical protein